MALKKKHKAKPGVPEWIVTFGDLMSLLLTFFILLQMFSELKQDREYQRVITAVKEAFGYSGGIGILPIDDPPLRSIVEQLEATALKAYKQKENSQSTTEGVIGPEMKVKTVREGLMFSIGGPSSFDEYSAELKPAVKAELEKLATMAVGRTTKVVIRGHAAAKLIPAGLEWKDLDDLSYGRAVSVKNELVRLGVEDIRIRLEAVGAREPVRPRAIDPMAAAENRRVDVILTEELVEDTNSDAYFTDPELARGG